MVGVFGNKLCSSGAENITILQLCVHVHICVPKAST